MKAIIPIINGPNLNLIGKREPEIYGTQDMEAFIESLRDDYPQILIPYYQSNHEGDLIDSLHQYGFTAQGILLNAGGYTHTSIALGDAVRAISSPVIEIHISNIYERETFRQHSYIRDHALMEIVGQGIQGYRLGLEAMLRHLGID